MHSRREKGSVNKRKNGRMHNNGSVFAECHGNSSLTHKFTVAPRTNMQTDLVTEELKSLLAPNGVTYLTHPKAKSKKTLGMHAEGNSAELLVTLLRRVISSQIYGHGTSDVVNTLPLAMEPNRVYAPLFTQDFKVRGVYRPASNTGVTSAKYSALMVNLLDVPLGSDVVVPTAGYLGETMAAALAGHNVFAGDISKWVLTGVEKLKFYTGDSRLTLTADDFSDVERSVRKHLEMGIPLHKLRNIQIFRWNAIKIPFKDGRFDAAVFDPPFGRATTPRETGTDNPIESALLFLKEARRLIKTGGPIVIRVPEKWTPEICDKVRGVNLVGVYNMPTDGMTIIKLRKN